MKNVSVIFLKTPIRIVCCIVLIFSSKLSQGLTLDECLAALPRLHKIGERLSTRIAKDSPLMKDLVEKSPKIKRIVKQLNSIHDGSQGVNNVGVYLVEMEDGSQKVLKVINGNVDFKNFKDVFWPSNPNEFTTARYGIRDFAEAQTALARLGLAPRLHGIIPPAEFLEFAKSKQVIFADTPMEKVIQESQAFELNSKKKKPFYEKLRALFSIKKEEPKLAGVIMDYVPDSPWNFKRMHQPDPDRMPGFMKQWSRKDVEKFMVKLRSLKKTMEALRIDPQDLQIFLNSRGEPILLDLDFYSILDDTPDLAEEFKDQAIHFIELWEAAQKIELSPEERYDLSVGIVNSL